jgi:hypothetical protein
MKSKGIALLLPLLLMVAVFFIIPGVGGAAMWIGAQGGVNFVPPGDVKGDLGPWASGRLKDVKTAPAALVGITVG